MMRRPVVFAAIGLTLLLILGPTLGQTTNTCPEIVRQALLSLGNNCANLGRNAACYGFNQVNTTFVEAVDEGFFSRPADRANLSLIERLSTTPLDEALAQWGIAVLNVQANVPDTLPGQAVSVVLMGDTEVENAVESVPPLNVSVSAPASIFTGPSLNNSVQASIAAGTALTADGLSEDGAWVRVQQPTGAGWVDRAFIDPAADVSALPTITADSQTPMQAFYFRTTFNDIACREAPSTLSIQSPENLQVDLTVNGAHIRLGSTVVLRLLPPGNAMQIMTVDGEAILEPDTPNEVVVPEGYTTQRCVGEPQDLGIDGEANDREVFDDCQWLYPVLLTPEEQQLGQFLFNTHNGLNQPAFVPTVTPFVPTVPPVPTCVTGQSITHTVVAGETLFNIALRYNTTINAIMVANRLTNSNSIFAGQQLVVNCGDQSNPPLPTEEVPPGAVDCSNFFPVFEDTVPYGDATFSWNPAPGATRYEVYFYVRDSQPIDAGTNTSVTIDVTSTAFSGEFAWTVTAYYNSRAVCGTQLVYVTREPGPDETAEPTETVVPPGSVDCATFRITSPLGGMAYGRETFYWDAAPGATSYTLVIAGETATTGFNAGTDTSITIDTTEGSIGFGLQFTWSVAALLDGRVACQSNAITIYRESAPSITPDPLPEITPDPSPEVTVSPSSSQEIDCINRGGVWIDDGYGNFFCDTYSRVD